MRELFASLGFRWRRWRRRRDDLTWDEIVDFLCGGPRG